MLTVLAFLLVWAALVAPHEPSRLTLGAFLRLPLEGVVLVALALVLPGNTRRILAWVVGPVLGLLILVKILDFGFFTAFDRPFDPGDDWSYTHIGIETLRQSIGGTSANLALAGVALLVVAAVVLPDPGAAPPDPRRGRPPPGVAPGGRGARRGLGALLGAGRAVRVRRAIASTSAAALVVSEVRTVRADIQERSRFAGEIRHDRYRHTPDNRLLTGLRGKDVLLVFVESYGKVAVEGSSFSPRVDDVLDTGTKQLRAAGFDSRSGWLTSPTFGGISWLAHSTMQSGVWVDKPVEATTSSSASERLTLSQAFGRAGWRTVDDVPSNNRYWPEGSSFYHYDKVYNRRNVGYHGPTYAYASMPDQYVYLALQRLELGKADRRPLFAEVDLVSSHEPWTQVPPLIAWNRVGDGSIFNKLPVDMHRCLGDTTGGLRPVGRVHAAHAVLVRAALRPQQPRAGRARRPPAGDGRHADGRQPRRADLDHRPRPRGDAPIAGMGLGGRHAPHPTCPDLADERLPRPLPRHVRLGAASHSAS